jgi:hypothetical protein
MCAGRRGGTAQCAHWVESGGATGGLGVCGSAGWGGPPLRPTPRYTRSGGRACRYPGPRAHHPGPERCRCTADVRQRQGWGGNRARPAPNPANGYNTGHLIPSPLPGDRPLIPPLLRQPGQRPKPSPVRGRLVPRRVYPAGEGHGVNRESRPGGPADAHAQPRLDSHHRS